MPDEDRLHLRAGGGFADLSPVDFLLRGARVFADAAAIHSGDQRFTYRNFLDHANRLAGALIGTGITRGDRVAVLLPNVPEMLVAHYAVPGIGAVLVPINTRLAAAELAYILEHSGARCLISHSDLDHVVDAALDALEKRPLSVRLGDDYDSFTAAASPVEIRAQPEDSLLSINYTSGTTGSPKGVMYTHRGAYLQTLGVIAECRLAPSTTYLWTLPMFHCHGWAFTWGVTAVGGAHVCLPRVEPAAAWGELRDRGVTHLCGAPTVLGMLLDADEATTSETPVRVYTGGAPPSPMTIERCEELGWDVTHLYGLTETYGPLCVSVWRPEWDSLPSDQRARLKARQGVGSVVSQTLRVVDHEMNDVVADGATVGEIVMRGNNVTVGYYRDEHASASALEGGWFHSGDLAVMHPDGYVEIRDRSKDVIISGGENISSIEVEQALAAHPSVATVAVVGVPHPHWGETPHAFVVPRAGAHLDTETLQEFVRARLAGFKVPRRISYVDELPMTSTGKVQKFRLREIAREFAEQPPTSGLQDG